MSDFEEPSKISKSSTVSEWSEDSNDSMNLSIKKSSKMIRGSVRSLMTQAGSAEGEGSASSSDDLIVHCGDVKPAEDRKSKRRRKKKTPLSNPHYDMLRTNKPETDMITCSSNYISNQFQISASDELNKKAEILTKKIAKDFFDWFTAMGEVEFKSEIKRPEDIEWLFQVWFDEHASRDLVLDPKILPCVLQSIANACGVPQASCASVLKRQVAYDVWAEKTPKHTTAFDACLSQKMKHLPPANNTRKLWFNVKIPDDLKTMSCVWEDISHLSSTKEFQKWLTKHPHLAMPPCLKALGKAEGKKPLFVVPSDFVVRGSQTSLDADLALPVSQFDMELKDVLNRLMNQ